MLDAYGVSAGTGWLNISVLWLDEISNLIFNFCLSVAAYKGASAETFSQISLNCFLEMKHSSNQEKGF